MAQFVLVHGAWHGAWCWRDVVAGLSARGHRVHAPTLTGLGDRSHLMSASISLDTHIQDVLGCIETEELDDLVLVVHSYAGMLGTALADRMPRRLRHLVYVDAVVPKPRESWSSTHASSTRQARLSAARASADFSFPPPDPAVFGLHASQADWVRRRQTPHPGHTYEATLDFDPARVASVARTFVNSTAPALATIDVSRTRIGDPRFWDGAWLGGAGVHVHELKTGHDPMISAPDALVDVLVQCV